MNKALVQVLGAVAYGELKAYEGAKADADAAPDEASRRRFRKVAAEELRHHKGFVARLEAMGADPERAMRPYRTALDRYHGHVPADAVTGAVFGYLGEGVADDLLKWLREVVDADTSAFIDTVIEDEVEHEAGAAADLRRVLASDQDGRRRAARASREMLWHMVWSGRDRAAPMTAFLRLGKPADLLAALLGGHARRMRAIGLGPFGLPVL
jgi:DNA-binding ferritin-like protein (Dps family)